MLDQNFILDSVKFENDELLYKQQHCDRVYESYRFLGRETPPVRIKNIYDELEKYYVKRTRPDAYLRIVFSATDIEKYSVEVKKITAISATLKLFTLPAPGAPDERSRYKWLDRARWDLLNEKKPAGYDDILLINEKNELIEASRFNVFVYDQTKAVFYTPPLTSGCLNGTFRRYWLTKAKLTYAGAERPLIERNILIDAVDEIYVGNAIRGLLRASL